MALLRRLADSGWGNNVANNHLHPGPFNREYWAPASCRSAHTHFIDPTIYDALRTVIGCMRYHRGHATYWALLQRSHTVSSSPSHGAWTSDPLSAHLPIGWECRASQIETPICIRRTTTHQSSRTTTEVRCSGRITGGMRSSWTTLRDSVLSSPTSSPILLEWPCQERRGSVITLPQQCRTFPLLLTQMGYGQWRAEVWWCPGRLLPWMPPYQILVLRSGVWWSMLLDIHCLWCHNMTSYSRWQTPSWRSLMTQHAYLGTPELWWGRGSSKTVEGNGNL